MAMIGIFGASFCSTEAIAAEVSQRLGYPVIGDALIEEAARYRGMSAERFARVFAGSRGLLNIVTHDWDKSVICVNAALARMLNMDQQICCGAAIHLIPGAVTHMLRVGITATDDYRVAQAVREKNCKGREAARLIRNNDEGISSWTRRLFNRDPWDGTLYDVQIALSEVSVTDAAEIICAKAQKRAVRPTDRSIQAVEDFKLAARVNLALLEGGYSNCDVSADRGDLSVVIRQGTPRGALARTVRALRYDRIDAEVRRIALTFEEVKAIAVRPGRSFKRRPRTLLVDGDQEYVETLSERLDLRDIVTEVVYDGELALTTVKTGLPDVMVLDLEMPGIHGRHGHMSRILVIGLRSFPPGGSHLSPGRVQSRSPEPRPPAPRAPACPEARPLGLLRAEAAAHPPELGHGCLDHQAGNTTRTARRLPASLRQPHDTCEGHRRTSSRVDRPCRGREL